MTKGSEADLGGKGQSLLVFQSMWAMELRSARSPEWSLDEKIGLIADAGYDGISADWRDRDQVQRLSSVLRDRSLVAEGQCFPTTVDDLKPALENAAEFGVHHLEVQPNVRPRRLQDCIPILEGWRRLAEQVSFPVYFETHRDRMTTDLFFTLDLLDCFPDLQLLSDVSHFVVGREFEFPVDAVNDAYIKRILDASWAFHGRVASREQVQVEISFPQHRPWFDQFLDWWEYGFRSWRARAPRGQSLAFTCELGPKPYAITGRDGEDTTDRWAEALLLRDEVKARWLKSATDPGA